MGILHTKSKLPKKHYTDQRLLVAAGNLPTAAEDAFRIFFHLSRNMLACLYVSAEKVQYISPTKDPNPWFISRGYQ